MLDEVQYAPAVFRHLKAAVDQRPEVAGQYILTGSQKYSLMKGASESLAGRAAILELETLSDHELLASAHTREASLAERIVRGGYPALWRDRSIATDTFFSSYVSSYIERDLRQLLQVSNLRDFDRFVRICAIYNGQLLNKANVSRDVGVAQSTITQWLAALQASNLITLLEPWHGNAKKRLVKTPKLYFNDTGLVCHLLRVDGAALTQSPFVGALWETFVFAELRKRLAAGDARDALYFYRDSQGCEVDFMMHTAQGIRLMECKWTELPEARDAANMLTVARDFEKAQSPFRIVSQDVVCRTASAYPLTEVARGVGLSSLVPT